MKDAISELATNDSQELINDCMEGRFPWKNLNNDLNSSISATDKRLIVDAFMRWQRCVEEKDLLIRDMRSFLKFYRDRIAHLEDEIKKKHLELDSNLTNNILINGEITLLKIGIKFCEAQLCRGTQCFDKIFKDGHEAEIVDEKDEDHIEATDLSEEFDTELVMVTGKRILKETRAPYITTALSCQSIVTRFPISLSQGAIGDRNGSSGCVLISLLICFTLEKITDRIDDAGIYNIFIGSMEIGNQLCEEVGVSSSLTVMEAQEIVSPILNVEIENEIDFFGSGETLIEKISDSLAISCYMVLIVEDKAYAVCKRGCQIFALDSHANPPFGAEVIITSESQLELLFSDFFNKKFNNDSPIYIASISF